MSQQPDEAEAQRQTNNHLSGQAQVHGPVIQAGLIRGDVVMQAPPPTPVPDVPIHVSYEYVRTSNDLYQWEDSEDMWVPEGAFRVLVEGLTAQAVVLKRMRPVVLSRTPPRPARSAGVIASILEVRGFSTDLDAESPVLTPMAEQPVRGGDGGRRSVPPDFPFTVTSSDPELFEIHPRSTFDVEWYLALEWASAGRTGSVTINCDGEPFPYRAVPPLLDGTSEIEW